MAIEFRTKRIYDDPNDGDGCRILVDRLWPRGVSKDAAQIDRWAKELTPTNDLRKFFHSNPTRYDEFVERYLAELESRRNEIDVLMQSLESSTVTLVTSTKDLIRGHVAILKRFLDQSSAGEAC